MSALPLNRGRAIKALVPPSYLRTTFLACYYQKVTPRALPRNQKRYLNQAPSSEEIEKEPHANSIARGSAVHERLLAAREIAKGSEAALKTNALKMRQEYHLPCLLAHVRDKFMKAKPTTVPRIPLDQR
jgi:hypothetical protein